MLRVLYAAGPGNVLGTYQHWAIGEEDPSQVSVTYSSQFFNVCRQIGAFGYIISHHSEAKLSESEQFKIEHRPKSIESKSSLHYHLGQLQYGLSLLLSALRWQADAVVIADGTTHWFVLSILPLLGVKIIPSLHCMPWNRYAPQNKVNRLIWRLNRFLFGRCHQALVVSQAIGEQIKQWMGKEYPPIQEFLPVYRQSEFASIAPPSADRSLFNVLYVGRIEADKGVFDLLEVAKRFSAEGRQDIRFDLCGDGSALIALQQAASEAGLSDSFVCHGHCNKTQMRDRFSQSHVVIAPTRTEFVEGFCKVVAEGVLIGRPVITSAVCPAIDYVRPAVVEVQPNDVKGYGDALLKLCDDRAFYEDKRKGCLDVQHQFYTPIKSWGSALKSTLLSICEARQGKPAFVKRRKAIQILMRAFPV
ncbi:glycosyltransferase family 4 protein [Microcoleus sp. FACHB-1515]|uniref:glycosyltransferase family 4 protein n=1 Tax=Cyanophyceae TaxID=3028117 RepID=UPI001682C1B5|nr:glycosyltransferase family 4 protein [Microcoleus sp. FACHB-1515]MBD2092022.1 glycosyltransferase family 4 protein [Microcoleus sp. FACHB-1515]